MRLLLISLCLSLTTLTLTAMGREFSHSRELPPLRLAAADLDAILLKTHALIAAANGPLAEQESARHAPHQLHVLRGRRDTGRGREVVRRDTQGGLCEPC